MTNPALEKLEKNKTNSKKYVNSIITMELNFQGKKNLFGLNIEHLKETAIMNWVKHEPEGEESHGIIQLDGKIVPIFDLSRRLGIKHEYLQNKISHLIILEHNKKLCAVITDSEPKIIQINLNENHLKKIKNSRYINNSVIVDDQLIEIIDILQILEDIEHCGALQFV